MSLTRTIVRNITANWIGFAVQIAVTLFLTPYVLSSLGDVRYGVWAIIVSLTGYYGFLDLGFRASLTQFIVRHLANKDYSKLNTSASTGFVVCAFVGGVTLLVSLVSAFLAPTMFGIPADVVDEVRLAIVIVGVGAALEFPFFAFSAVFPATQRYDIANLIGVVTRCLQALGTWFALSAGYGLIGISTAIFVANLTDYVIRWRISYRLIPQLKVSPGMAQAREFGKFFRFGMWNTLIQGGQRVINYSDILLIGLCLPITAVTPFALAASIMAFFDAIVTRTAWVFHPVAAGLIARNEVRKLQQMYMTATRLMYCGAAILAIVGMYWAQEFFTLWVGTSSNSDSISLTAGLFIILVIAATVTAGQKVGDNVLFASERLRPLAQLWVLQAALNIGISAALVHSLGLWGIAWGTLISAILVKGIWHAVVVCRQLNISAYEYFYNILCKLAGVSAVVASGCWAIRLLAPRPDSWFLLIMHGMLAGIVGGVAFILFALSSVERSRYIFRTATTVRVSES